MAAKEYAVCWDPVAGPFYHFLVKVKKILIVCGRVEVFHAYRLWYPGDPSVCRDRDREVFGFVVQTPRLHFPVGYLYLGIE